MQYDVAGDFASVTRGVIAPMVIVTHPDTHIKTMAELVERGKREPEKLNYGTAGTGSPLYIGVRMLEEATGARFTHVPYKGAGPAYQDLLAGRLQFMLTDLATVRSFIDAGRLVPVPLTPLTLPTNREVQTLVGAAVLKTKHKIVSNRKRLRNTHIHVQ